MTLSERTWLDSALEAIEAVKTEQELLAWDSEVSSDPHYLSTDPATIRQLEAAYDRKLREITGWGAA